MKWDGPDLDPRALLRQGDAAVKNGDLAQAVKLYEQAGEMYEVLDARLKAVGVWKGILHLKADRIDIRIRLAEGLAALAITEEASDEFRRVVEAASAAGNRELLDRASLGLSGLTR